MSNDYEFGVELHKMFGGTGITAMRHAFREALTRANGRVDQLPDVLRGWFDRYRSPESYHSVTDHRFFRSLRKQYGLNLTESQETCPRCNGTGKQPANPSGYVPNCYICNQTGKVTRWALS